MIFRSQSCETCRIIAFGDEGDEVPHPKVLKSALGPDCEPEWFLAKPHRGSSGLSRDVCVLCCKFRRAVWLSLLRQWMGTICLTTFVCFLATRALAGPCPSNSFSSFVSRVPRARSAPLLRIRPQRQPDWPQVPRIRPQQQPDWLPVPSRPLTISPQDS